MVDEPAPEATATSAGGDPLATDREDLRTLHAGWPFVPGRVGVTVGALRFGFGEEGIHP